ncbi:MAG: hypothetical protein RMJ35_12760 [Phycisphaerales bacterium]|nr:hypothetical protein [Phycisphaerales bacterium]
MRLVVVIFCVTALLANTLVVMPSELAGLQCGSERTHAGLWECCCAEGLPSSARSAPDPQFPDSDCPACFFCKVSPAGFLLSAAVAVLPVPPASAYEHPFGASVPLGVMLDPSVPPPRA